MLVRLHEESSNEQDAGDDDEEERVLERGPQTRPNTLVLLQFFKVKVGQWDPEEDKAGNQAIGNCGRNKVKLPVSEHPQKKKKKIGVLLGTSFPFSVCLLLCMDRVELGSSALLINLCSLL